MPRVRKQKSTHQSRLRCSTCSTIFSNQSGLTQHRRLHWKTVDSLPAAQPTPPDNGAEMADGTGADFDMPDMDGLGRDGNEADESHVNKHPILDGA